VPEEEKESEEVSPIEVLEALWAALKDNYPAFEYVVGATGDAWRDEFHSRLESVVSLSEAYPILETLVHRFHDYHTGLHWPDKPVLATPPGIRLGWVEDVVAVIAAPETMDALLRAGDVILAIDGEDALTLYRQKVAVARGATPYARQQWACDRLLEGTPDTTVSVRIRREGRDDESMVVLEREGRRGIAIEPVEVRREADDVGYIRILSWGPKNQEEFLSRFDAALEEFRELPYLVLDVRGNGGGSDALADQVTGRFLRAPIVSSISFHREAGTNRYEKTVEIAQPRGPWRYEGRVAVLTDEGCCSACEHFVSGMRASGVALLIGRPTTGACGWSKAIALPGGATLYCSLTFPFHGTEPSPLHGIEPDRLVLPTLEALRAGSDLILDEAIACLRSGR
jgi:carboxyl-terminal processing protease